MKAIPPTTHLIHGDRLYWSMDINVDGVPENPNEDYYLIYSPNDFVYVMHTHEKVNSVYQYQELLKRVETGQLVIFRSVSGNFCNLLNHWKYNV
jgi:hypothetical protein